MRYNHGYTMLMKTAISIPDTVFQSAESLAQRLGVSRSELYSKAVEEFINSNNSQGVTEILNRVYHGKNSELDDDYYGLQVNSLDKEDW